MFKIVEKVGTEAKINIFPKQADFINSDVDELLYGGAAGGGKSYGMLLFGLKRRLEFPHSAGIFFRRTYPELEKSLIRHAHEIYPHFGAEYKEVKKKWVFPNKSIQEFGSVENESDVYDYHSAQYHDIGFDEASLFTEFQLTYLTSRCRTDNPAVKALVRYASNPGGVSHGFFKRRFIDPYQTHRIWKDELTGKTFTFIPARFHDNLALSESDPGYLDRLRDLGEKKYLALAEGRWDVWEGQYFEGFDSRPGMSHVLWRPRVPSTESRKIIGLDWGFKNPACALWAEITPMGRVFIYRELYITLKSPKELAKIILSMTTKEEEIDYLCASPEIWGKKVELEGGGEPIQELMQDVFKNRIKMVKANNARVPGWMKMREFMMKAPDGYPWLQISPDCTNLIRTIPEMIHDEHRPEDISIKCEDHACECARYLLVSVHDIPKDLISPFESGYHKIFGIPKKDHPGLYSDGPMPTGKGGY